MKYNKLDTTDINASAIGFGCWQLGGELSIAGNPQSYGKINEKEARKAINHALELGINFFDTADIYGLGKSEYILGEELKKARSNTIICSKVGYVPDGINGTITDCSKEHIIASCNRSLKRLKTDYLDIYLLHFIPEKEKRAESLNALKNLKDSGKIKEYGISIAHNLEKIPELADDFRVIEGYYNLLLRKYEDFKSIIKEKGVAFIAASPLSRGLLGGKNYNEMNFDNADVRKKWQPGEQQHEWYRQQEEKVSKLANLAQEWNIPLKNLSLAYILSNNIFTTIPGMKSKKEVDELVESLKYVPLTPKKINKIREI